MTVTGRPEHIARIFRAGGTAYGRVDSNAAMILGEHSLSALEGADYLTARRRVLSAPGLRDPSRSADLYATTTARVCDAVADGRTVSMLEVARSITLDANIQAIFGFVDPEERRQFADSIHALRRAVPVSAILIKALRRDLGRWSPWGRFVRARSRCFALIDRRVARFRSGDGHGSACVLEHWSACRTEDGRPEMSDAEIRENLLTLLFAGHDTTAAALAWAINWVHREPSVLLRLREELAAPVAARGGPTYLDAVVSETLRLYPIAPGSIRRLKDAMTMDDVVVPAGDLVMASTDLSLARPERYEIPWRFRPERFLQGGYKANEYLPFGGGERRCPGASMAQEAVRTMLATILRRYDVTLRDRRPTAPKWENGIRVPRSGVRLSLTPRGTGRQAP